MKTLHPKALADTRQRSAPQSWHKAEGTSKLPQASFTSNINPTCEVSTLTNNLKCSLPYAIYSPNLTQTSMVYPASTPPPTITLGTRFPPYRLTYNLGTHRHSLAYLFLSCLAPRSKLTEKGVTAHTCLAECSCFHGCVANTFTAYSS